MHTFLVYVFAFAVYAVSAENSLHKRATAFFNPTRNGGSMLDNATGSSGEPLNVIISGLSSSDVLTSLGFLNYARSIGFSSECLNLHIGALQTANLGDGNGPVNQTFELRQDFGSSSSGTCIESLLGGNHFRGFSQNGTLANSGAIFLAVSQEKDVFKSHIIAHDGYNVGRDALVAAAVGSTKFGDVSYTTTSERITGLLAPGVNGINHNISQDGVVVLLTVLIN